MKILILGSGLMGPAVAFNAMADPEVKQVILCDASQPQLAGAMGQLTGRPGADKLTPVQLDLNDPTVALE